jgi:SAM-dependent methyltransferase
MFWPDVIALKQFYATPTGQAVFQAIARHLNALWPRMEGETVAGIGFATPYLASWQEEALTLAFMPAMQGVMHWPQGALSRSALIEEAELPLSDNSVSRVIVAHALENSENARRMLAEIWRVLTPSGRVIVIAPNRLGMWARALGNPFAYGQPFTPWQLRELLAEYALTPLHARSALFFPPSRQPSGKGLRLWEGIGGKFFAGFGGVLLMEAEKQLYAATRLQARQPTRKSYPKLAQPAGAFYHL